MFKEFRKFIARGNVIDLAVGIVLGTAFTAIVNSLVKDVIMPPLGLLIGEVDFSRLSITVRAATADTEAVTIGIGIFINAVVQFIIVGFAVFVIVRMVNRLSERVKKQESIEEEAAPPEPGNDEKLLTAINELTVTIRSLRRRPAPGGSTQPRQPSGGPEPQA